jgi:transcriptional regulator with XRE-family HTH domain
MTRGPLPPLVYKSICGHRLKALRERAGLTQEEAGQPYGWSQEKVSHIENARTAMKPANLDPLLDRYKVDKAAREECHRLAALSTPWPAGRRTLLRNRFHGKMRDVIDMEAAVATLWCHNSMVIPGLLQTEDYMRNIFRAYRPSLSQHKIDQDVANRLERQAVLDNPDQQFWFVIHEAALRSLENIDGGDAVLRGQAKHLMEAIDRPNVEVQIAPFRHGYYPGQAETYMIFEFDTDPPVQVTYVEKYDGGDILHGDRMERFLTAWEHQQSHALGPERTRPFLRKLSRPS